MKTVRHGKVTREQQENAKNTRRSLRTIQQVAGEKENLVGRSKKTKFGDNDKIEMIQKAPAHKAVQTGEVTAGDLTSEEASVDYWRVLAEKRQESLDESLKENERLKEKIGSLFEKNRICKEMLEESTALVEVLQGMLEESDVSTENVEEATERL